VKKKHNASRDFFVTARLLLHKTNRLQFIHLNESANALFIIHTII